MTKVLVVDQFCGLSPYQLQKSPPVPFDSLIAAMFEQHESRPWFHKPQVLEVDDDYTPPFATTVLRANQDGNAEVWKYRWDSSG